MYYDNILSYTLLGSTTNVGRSKQRTHDLAQLRRKKRESVAQGCSYLQEETL